jgi:hypothetical protein
MEIFAWLALAGLVFAVLWEITVWLIIRASEYE